MDSAQWLASYRERLDRMAADARTVQENMRQAGGHAASPRGEVEVSVGPGGALTGLRLAAAARKLEVDQLAQLILDTAQQAHRAAGAKAVGIMADYVGEGPALERLREHLPALAEQSDTRTEDDYYAEPEIINK